MTKFETEFLDSYLKLGLGSMPKTDIDALVMFLLDKHGLRSSGPLARLSNQQASELLKTPVARIKKLRYEAALKFGGRPEDQAMGKLLAALANATLELQGDKICLIVEDTLAKNWLQGQLKVHQQIFDHPFSAEIVRVSAEGLFRVLDSVFDKAELATFKQGHEAAKKAKTAAERTKIFKSVATKFAEGAAKSAGAAVLAVVKEQLGLP
jgi:alpha-D-ribose 1-methylphosphonate 5-triphosphate synthase subunit PhnH